MMCRVLVCGGRDYDDRAFMFRALDQLHDTAGFDVLIHGAARGADTLAGAWARERGVRVHTFRADWGRYGQSAGPIRNQQMLDEGRPDLVVAFPGGRGTADMVRRAMAAKIIVRRAV